MGGQRKNISDAQCKELAAAGRPAIDCLHRSEVQALAVDCAAPSSLPSAGWDHAQDQAVLVAVLVRAVGLAAMANGLAQGCSQGTSLVEQIVLHRVFRKNENYGLFARPSETEVESNLLNTSTFSDKSQLLNT